MARSFHRPFAHVVAQPGWRLLSLLALGLLWTVAATAANYNFAGRVLDDATGQPLPGVSVKLQRVTLFTTTLASTTTPADGTFSLSTDTSGTLQLEASLSGFLTRAVGLGNVSTPTTMNDIEIRLARPASVSVRVIDAVSGTPLQTQLVNLEGRRQPTDAQGQTLFTNVAPGNYRVCVQTVNTEYLNVCLEGYPSGFSYALAGPTLAVAGGQALQIEFALQRGGVISGRIDDVFAGGALANSSVDITLFDAAGTFLHQRAVGTDAAGIYRLTGLPAGSYRVTAGTNSAPQYSRRLYPDLPCGADCPFAQGAAVSVAPPATTTGIDFALSPATILTGRITDAQSGAPLPGVRVLPYEVNPFSGVWTASSILAATSDVDGHFELAYLRSGQNLRLGTSGASGYRNLGWPNAPCGYDNCGGGTSFALAEGESRDGFDFALTPGPAFRGRTVAIGTTRPVAAEVRVYDSGRVLAWAGRSNAAGDYVSSALPPGGYYVRAFLGAPDNTCSWYGDALCPIELTTGDFASAPLGGLGDTLDSTGIDIGLRTLLLMRDGFE